MSAIRLLPWSLHQAIGYLAGILCILAPFLLGFADSAGPLSVFIGTGIALLALGVLGRGSAGVAQVLPAGVHVALTYLVGFLLLVAPFVFGFADQEAPLATAVFIGLGLVVATLVAAVPEGEPDEADAADATGATDDHPPSST